MGRKTQRFISIGLGILLIALIVAVTLRDAKSGTNAKKKTKKSREDYEHEFSNRCSFSYRMYDDTNIDLPAGRDRCKVVCNYDPSRYEYYCPHNARQYGVSLCDQGTIM